MHRLQNPTRIVDIMSNPFSIPEGSTELEMVSGTLRDLGYSVDDKIDERYGRHKPTAISHVKAQAVNPGINVTVNVEFWDLYREAYTLVVAPHEVPEGPIDADGLIRRIEAAAEEIAGKYNEKFTDELAVPRHVRDKRYREMYSSVG